MAPSLLLFLTLLTTLSLTTASKTPIYVGEVFIAPALTLLAWRPSSDSTWCHSAIALQDDAFTLPSSSSSSEAIKLHLHDYFSTTSNAYLADSGGKKYAECAIAPNSVPLSTCEGLDEIFANAKKEGKTKMDLMREGKINLGAGRRKWACWVLDGEDGAHDEL
ncbi:hypothetical protein F5884DRAFT_769188 [Xylogone sp. PMI_703]|nr:hypothetical protein F5884DRAFT_769188 [Xylogone sp. PMI_703]